MTDDFAAFRPSSPTGVRRRGLTLVAVPVLLLSTAVACGSDSGSDPAASDPTTSTTTPTASSGSSTSASPSDSGSPSPTTTGDPVPSPVIDKAVKAAIRAGFPALVPSGVPAGWSVTSATYDGKGGGTWRIDLTDASGAEVVLVQGKTSVKALVGSYLPGATVEGKVDLGSSGTGVWTAYGAVDQHGIAKSVAHTAALVYGATQDAAVELANQLLTAEDSGNGSGDG